MQTLPPQPAAAARPEISKQQRLAPRRWAQCLAGCNGDHNVPLHSVYSRHGLTMTTLAQATGLPVSRVSRVMAALKAAALVA